MEKFKSKTKIITKTITLFIKKVILTTVLNLYNGLSLAWTARPSVFKTYTMQEYL